MLISYIVGFIVYRTAGLPHADSHSNDDMEIKPGIAEMIREEERVSLNHFVSFNSYCCRSFRLWQRWRQRLCLPFISILFDAIVVVAVIQFALYINNDLRSHPHNKRQSLYLVFVVKLTYLLQI